MSPLEFIPSHVSKWRSCPIPVPEKDRELYLQAMVELAKGLSEATGQDIRWHYVLDSGDNCFGDWGLFKRMIPNEHFTQQSNSSGS